MREQSYCVINNSEKTVHLWIEPYGDCIFTNANEISHLKFFADEGYDIRLDIGTASDGQTVIKVESEDIGRCWYTVKTEKNV